MPNDDAAAEEEQCKDGDELHEEDNYRAVDTDRHTPAAAVRRANGDPTMLDAAGSARRRWVVPPDDPFRDAAPHAIADDRGEASPNLVVWSRWQHRDTWAARDSKEDTGSKDSAAAGSDGDRGRDAASCVRRADGA